MNRGIGQATVHGITNTGLCDLTFTFFTFISFRFVLSCVIRNSDNVVIVSLNPIGSGCSFYTLNTRQSFIV